MGLFDRKAPELTSEEKDQLRNEIADLRGEIAGLKAVMKARQKELGLTDDIIKLKNELVDLQIEKAKVVEEQERRERELTHMIGLEKKRQEQELAAGKREAVLAVQEKNLEADKARFEDQMDFMTDRFEKEVGYLKDIMGQVLDRLPTVTVDKTITDKTTRT